MFKFLLFVTLVAVTLLIPHCDGDCIWYKVCYPEPDDLEDDEKAYNCPNDGPGYQLEDPEAQEIMLRVCPELFTNCKPKNLNDDDAVL